MFRKVMFRWADQRGIRTVAGRLLNVQTLGGQRAAITFDDLDAFVGESERRRLVSVAIRNGSGKWHREDKRRALPRLLAAVLASADEIVTDAPATDTTATMAA